MILLLLRCPVFYSSVICKVGFDRIIIHEPHNICPVLFCSGVFVKFGFIRQLIHKPHILDKWPVLFCSRAFVKFGFGRRITHEIPVKLHFFIQLC